MHPCSEVRLIYNLYYAVFNKFLFEYCACFIKKHMSSLFLWETGRCATQIFLREDLLPARKKCGPLTDPSSPPLQVLLSFGAQDNDCTSKLDKSRALSTQPGRPRVDKFPLSSPLHWQGFLSVLHHGLIASLSQSCFLPFYFQNVIFQ